MRKIKLQLQCRVPSWNFCNLDDFTSDLRMSKELCRFCVKTKSGYRCVLHDCALASDAHFVNKTRACIDATAGYAVTADEPQQLPVNPRVVIREAIKLYTDTVASLVKQGYPQALAETIAKQYMDKS